MSDEKGWNYKLAWKADVLWEGQNWSGIVASVLERNRISRTFSIDIDTDIYIYTY